MQKVQGRIAAGVLAAAASALMLAGVAGASPKGKTTICHQTHSATNPWVRITVSNASLKAHLSNHGDIIPAPAAGCPGGGGDDGGGGDGGGGDVPT